MLVAILNLQKSQTTLVTVLTHPLMSISSRHHLMLDTLIGLSGDKKGENTSHVVRRVEVVPPSRIQAMVEYNRAVEQEGRVGPCGGYSTMYACMCDYHALPYRDEVAWSQAISLQEYKMNNNERRLKTNSISRNLLKNLVMNCQILSLFDQLSRLRQDVDTIYLSHDSKELSLLDFDHLEGRDLVPIISALAYNCWFSKFRASNTRLVSWTLGLGTLDTATWTVEDTPSSLIFLANLQRSAHGFSPELTGHPSLLHCLPFKNWSSFIFFHLSGGSFSNHIPHINQLTTSSTPDCVQIAEALDQILYVMKRSIALEELYLDNIGIKWDFAHKLSLTLISNANTALHTLDLSNNLIEDKGINSLCGIIAKMTQDSPRHLSPSDLASRMLTSSSADRIVVPHHAARPACAGVGHLSGPVGKLQKGLTHLNLSRTGLTSKGANTLAHALSLNRAMPSTLVHLSLSDNIFREDVTNLYNFLAQPNSLVHLDLSGTECALDTVFGALLRGCTQKLAYLNLSRNQFTNKKSKEVVVPPSFKAFFSSTVALKFLNMSHNKLPIDALKAMLLGLACNEIATEVALDLSNADLRSQGALVLESCLPGIRCLSSLDIVDNVYYIEQHLWWQGLTRTWPASSMPWLRTSPSSISTLGKTSTTSRPSRFRRPEERDWDNMWWCRHMTRVLDSLVQLLQEEDAVLETLAIADSKLRQDTCLVINALGSNQSLTSIDIRVIVPMSTTASSFVHECIHCEGILATVQYLVSQQETLETFAYTGPSVFIHSDVVMRPVVCSGNYMGAIGAKTLAKALQVNTKLHTLKWDRNATPPQGFLDIAYAMEKNFSLRYMPWPILDATAAMKVAPDRTEMAFRKIDHFLHRNVSPKKYSNTQALRLQQGFLLGPTHQMVDRLMVRLQDSLGTAARATAEGISCQEEMLAAEGYLTDASNAKQLMVRLQEVVLQQDQPGNVVDRRLQECSRDIQTTIDTHLLVLYPTWVDWSLTRDCVFQSTASCLLKCIEDQCPNIIGDDHVRRDLERVCQERGVLPADFVRQTLLDQAGTDILSKVG
ncbi:crml-1 [Cordylochernes scorpioides]|uniref:Crml-1 n=1 Tax=Cordylochernes scorpioides TaxID=51811 RepID=A0ABY6LJH8_9ARAC|nr:crml-1 [Cordylochernes scorpioides]